MKKSTKKSCQYGGKCMEQGGYSNPPGMFWNGERYVKTKGSGTYSGGTYFQQGGPTSNPGYYPPKQQPGYWKFDNYGDDGGNIQEIQYGGHIMGDGGPFGDRPAYQGNAWKLPKIPISQLPSHEWDGVIQPDVMGYENDYLSADRNNQGRQLVGEEHNLLPNPHTTPAQPNWQSVNYRGQSVPLAPPGTTTINTVTKNDYLGKNSYGSLNRQYGGYIPAPINAPAHIPQQTNGTYHMQGGGPVAPKVKQEPGYWNFYPYGMDGGNITEVQYGGPIHDTDDLTPEYRKGGIHINPANKGKFNATKKATGKTTEELTHSSNPLTRKRAIFAQNAAKWHHQYGGPANPFHPLAQYADGGFGPGNPDEEVNASNIPAATQPMNPSAQYNDPMATGVAQPTSYGAGSAQPNATWRAGMTDKEAQTNINAGGQSAITQPTGPNGWQKAVAYGQGFNNLLGAGLMTAANFANRRSEKNNAAYNRSLGMTSNMPMYQNPGGHGDYSQQGYFRPDKMGISNPGFYSPGHAQYGGPMKYEHGGEYHMSDAEIKRLRAQGYTIEEL